VKWKVGDSAIFVTKDENIHTTIRAIFTCALAGVTGGDALWLHRYGIEFALPVTPLTKLLFCEKA
jgi:hypothetical protein